MLRHLMLVPAVAVALMAFAPPAKNVLADEIGRGPSVILAHDDRPEGYVYYRVWYTSRRMNYWAVYSVAQNRRLAENVSSMLVGLGYDTWIEPFSP